MKKFLPYIFIAIIFLGFFPVAQNVEAVTVTGCYNNRDVLQNTTAYPTREKCEAEAAKPANSAFGLHWVEVGGQTAPPADPCLSVGKPGEAAYENCKKEKAVLGNNTTTPPTPTDERTALEKNLSDCRLLTGGFDACFVKAAYYVFYVFASWLLNLIANVFNVILVLALSSSMYTAKFISDTWVITRDISNIFFIFILIYIAIKTIVGQGGHDTKKVIAQVIVMALVINFSMFFTKIVIDASNVLALVFYDKINVENVDKNGNVTKAVYVPILNEGKAGSADKDLSGALVSKFDPTKLLDEAFFKKVKERSAAVPTASSVGVGLGASVATGALAGNLIPIPGVGAGVGAVIGGIVYALSWTGQPAVSPGIMFSIIITAGAIMLFAAYAFFIASLSFLGRLIELWVLIIFSPFAFMSSALPILGKVPYIGWSQWLSKLLKTAFMAPIFMFFMYFIFKIAQTNIWSELAIRNTKDQGMVEFMIFLILPALIILTLLIQATKFAKEGSGQVGEAIIGVGKAAVGLALGGTALGVAALGRGTAGALLKGASMSESAEKYAQFKAGALPASALSTKDRTYGWLGHKINKDQHDVEHAAHARHDLDEAANVVAKGKKWDQLNADQKRQVRVNLERDVEKRNMGLGNKSWSQLSQPEQSTIDAAIASRLATKTTTADLHTIKDAKRKQGLVSTVGQSAVSGSYDIRNLANVVMKEQSTGWAKIAAGLTGAVAMSMRGGLKSVNINYGAKPEGNFLKDLGTTVTEALKSTKINLDLSEVGKEKKESGGGGHH